MVSPTATGSGVSVRVIERSARTEMTVVVAVPVLLAGLGSKVVDVALALLAMVGRLGTPGGTCTTMVSAAEAPPARAGLVKMTVPVPPAAGPVIVQPAGAAAETNVVLSGGVSAELGA